MIKHIVMAAGGYKGLYVLGALYELNKKIYNIENIKTIYGTSIGAYIGVLLCLKMEWADLLNYVINRPWHKAFQIPSIARIFNDKGFADPSCFGISLENLFLSLDLSLNITMQGLYDFSQIELHMFTVEVQEFKLIDISYKTHPNLKVIEGLHQTCAIPYVFKPNWFNGNFYIDGGILNDYPLDECIQNGADITEILGIKFEKVEELKHPKLKQDCNIIEFSRHLHSRFIDICRKYTNTSRLNLENELIIRVKQSSNINECLKLIKDKELRESYIEEGKQMAILGGLSPHEPLQGTSSPR